MPFIFESSVVGSPLAGRSVKLPLNTSSDTLRALVSVTPWSALLLVLPSLCVRSIRVPLALYWRLLAFRLLDCAVFFVD
jgi:hypothetical protein